MENDLQMNVIGKMIEIVDSQNKSLIGKKGKIKMETKNMIQLDNGTKLIKNQIEIKINGKIVQGKSLVGRLDSRIKKSGSKI